GLRKLEPSPLATTDVADRIRPANYDQHLAELADCDLVIEAIAERLDWKRDLFERIAPHLAPDALLASNTSGLSINALAEVLPQALRERFCGIHFFNPPRYMHLVELIPATGTAPAMLDRLESFLVTTLGKGVIRAKDTPNFIANRVGTFSILAAFHHTRALGLGFDAVDAITGPLLGRAKSATYRTADVVGLDTLAHVVGTLQKSLADDPWHAYFNLPDWYRGLVEAGALGQKTKRGIYRKQGKTIEVLDVATKDYRPSDAEAAETVVAILKQKDPALRLEQLRASDHPQARFLWAVTRDMLHYCAVQLESIADNARDLDLAIRWGFGWREGPFELWQAAGWQRVAGWIADDIAAGKAMAAVPLPAWVTEPSRVGVHEVTGSFSPQRAALQPRSPLPVYRRQIVPDRLVGEPTSVGTTVFETDAVRCWSTGDDIAIVSFKSKMHAIGEDVLDGMTEAIETAEREFRGLVIWQTEPPFSVGANLSGPSKPRPEGQKRSAFGSLMKKVRREAESAILKAARKLNVADALMAGRLEKVEGIVAQFQATSQALRYSAVPTVAAVDGLALGGGCEFVMHVDRAVATLESYIGLVEAGVGLIPGGGGCKEFAMRVAADAKGGDPFPFLRRAFETVATAQVGRSAAHARELGYLRATDRIVMNRFELLHVAKSELIALDEAGYRPPLPANRIAVAGRAAVGTVKAHMTNLLIGGHISEHDYLIGAKVAHVLCGGDVEAGSLVDEQWLLDLEREAFMELLATEKTQARVEHMLKTGKPLRN
ncbi:MAG: 3-hydroxyacyl-CoA dehydrogenase/enoyl-CoA hydratase family protein, partial [Burkholderiales bacterium]|nr:3-hydroxyacyl-CoA dehydrogenase/enoyl-CoA hydratase family protein [Burkholderiales bacterium]